MFQDLEVGFELKASGRFEKGKLRNIYQSYFYQRHIISHIAWIPIFNINLLDFHLECHKGSNLWQTHP